MAFNNDFSSLGFEAPNVFQESPLFKRRPAHGECRVLCWTRRHDLTLATMPQEAMKKVVDLWVSEYERGFATPHIQYTLIFENKGTEIGVSNPHPHGQVYSTSFIPDTIRRMRETQWQYYREHGRSLLLDMNEQLQEKPELVVEETESFVAYVPFEARFAYETRIVPKDHHPRMITLSSDERQDLARVYQRMAQRYNLLFNRESPNITLIYNAPCDDHEANESWQCHISFLPPLRDQDKLKYLAGFEAGSGDIINPVQPEEAARRLRTLL